MPFTNFKLDPALLKAIQESGYTTPTPIQAQAIPAVLSGRDLIASAQTGTGKTAAFVLPTLQHLLATPSKHGKPRVLILTPTRELAQQVTDSAQKYGKHMRFTAISIVGGLPYRQQFRQLSRPLDMIIATPGRFMDIMERPGSIDLSQIDFLILDEADRMLDMGFIDDVAHIAKQLEKASKGKPRQTLLFSATLDARIAKLAKNLLTDPAIVEVSPLQSTHTQIEQRLYIANDISHKNKLLDYILENESIHQGIIFSGTKRHADSFAKHLRDHGHAAVAMHGDMKQTQRNRTLDQLRAGKIQFLVATDVAARGIDVRGISHVINYDLPRTGEDYTHRIGRTGRAGNTGIAITFALSSEGRTVQLIERTLGSALAQHTVPGLEPRAGFRHGGGGGGNTKSFGGKKKFGRSNSSGRPAARSGGGKPGGFKKPEYARRDSDTSSRFDKPRRSSEGGKKPEYARRDSDTSSRFDKPRRSSEGGKKPEYARRDSDTSSRFAKPRRSSEGGNASRFEKPAYAKKPEYARRDSDASPRFAKPRRSSEGGNASRFEKPAFAKKPEYARRDSDTSSRFAKPRRSSEGGNASRFAKPDFAKKAGAPSAGFKKLGLKKKLGTKPTAPARAKRKKVEE